MTVLLLIMWGTLFFSLVLLMAIRPERSRHSWFELKRGNDQKAMRRERLLNDINAVLRFCVHLLILLLAITSFVLWQWGGLGVVVIALFFAMMMASHRRFQRVMTKAYTPYEGRLLDFVEKFSIVGKLFGSERYVPRDQHLESTDQLVHLVESAGHILSTQQQMIIKRSVNWHSTPVRDIMTPRESIRSVKHKELLGPLVLDDLHRSGHTRFPVIEESIDAIIGILNVTDLLEIDGNRKSQIVEKIMVPQVLRIKGEDSLPVAMKLLQKSHQHVLVVVDDEGRTEGMLTLTDITSSLLGR